jgi:hypothetical protein
LSKSKLNSLLSAEHYSPSDLVFLKKVVQEKPYFQSARFALARASRQLKDPNHKIYTNFALIYSTEKNVLKAYVLDKLDFKRTAQSRVSVKDISTEEKSEVLTQPPATTHPIDHLNQDQLDNLIHEIELNIKEIEENKAKFFSQDWDMNESTKKSSASKKKSSTHSKKKVSEPVSGKVKRAAKKTIKTTTRKDADDKKANPGVTHSILEELEHKKEVEKLGKTQLQQIKIIDDFLNNPIELKENPLEELIEPVKDLSTNSVEKREDIISENLANIHLKQGKKDKAIDILKKLIWKFPQKKAYFAGRIEEIKKS